MSEKDEEKTCDTDKCHINVCNVKDREVYQGKINKIHYIVKPYTVDKIAQRTRRQNSSEDMQKDIFCLCRHPPKCIEAGAQDKNSHYHKEKLLSLKDSECRAPVFKIF